MPAREKPRKRDIDRILYARGQVDCWDAEELYAQLQGLHDEFPGLVDENGGGWFWRHIRRVADFVEHNLELISSAASDKAQKIKKGFDVVWRNKVKQFQMPLP